MPPEEQSRPRKCPRKQLLLKLGVFLLLGVVVNVAVAWGCCLPDSAVLGLPFATTDADRTWWKEAKPSGFSEIPLSKADCRGFGWRLSALFDETAGSASLIPCPMAMTFRAGWPILALDGDAWIDISGNSVAERSLTPVDWFNDETRLLVTAPLWPGFAINTIFYAAMLCLLWFAPGRIKRFIRVHRGRCPACGYIIAPGTAAASTPGGPCSECGACCRTG
jgi:hypothetical protein